MARFPCYDAALNPKLPQFALATLLIAWLAIATPGLRDQYSETTKVREMLGGRSVDERTALLDNPGFRVAEEIELAVPADSCVLVLAYSGPAAVDYYQARLAYYLYPRRVRVADRVSAPAKGCEYLAVFRDSAQNLAGAPFRGGWDEQQLKHRLAALDPLSDGDFADIFRAR